MTSQGHRLMTAKPISRARGALLAAHKNGYCMLPRKADVQAIAAKERVPRTTFQEHFKKAENKLLGALVHYATIPLRVN